MESEISKREKSSVPTKRKKGILRRILIFMAIIYFGYHIFIALFEKQIKEYHQSKIETEITYDPTFCNYEKPLKLVIHNGSMKNVSHFNFMIYVFKEGESGYINEPGYSITQIDVEIPKKSMFIDCYQVPYFDDHSLYSNQSKLLYKIGHINYFFE